jgi:Spy/CpxP family protein refolding chaperone
MSETPATRKAAVWVVIVFLLGIAAGGMLGYSYAHRSVAAASAPLSEPERRAKRVKEFTELLALSSDQAKQLDAIILQRHTEMKAIHEETNARIEQEHQKGRDQIRAILTPEQKPKFEAFLARIDAERKKNPPQGTR